MQKLKILVSCYACSPYRGSEPGMGWNFVKGISAFHEVHVLVEQLKWETDITKYLDENPELKQNLKFYFIKKKRNKRLRKIWSPSYYWFYKQWQQKAYQLALKLNNTEHFDVVHQLNMVGYREPGYLWKMAIPFVWGPIGGLENTPWSFLPSLGFKGMLHFTGRNLINTFQKHFSSRPKQAASRKNNTLIAATPDNQSEILNVWGKHSKVICEVGKVESNIVSLQKREKEALRIVWSGVHEPRKNLQLLLFALANVKIDYELHILGSGTETESWRKLSNKLGVDINCIWHGWLPLDKSLNILQSGHLFCVSSIHDLTSTVLLEAISFGLPVVCLDHCGFSYVINDASGIKIPVTNPKQGAKDFANTIEKLYHDEALRYQLAEGALNRSKDFSWDKKIVQLNNIYKSVVE